MATTVGLIRHGVTELNSLGKAQGISDIPLSEEGTKQDIALANNLTLLIKWKERYYTV
ncbi:broad specificity phosphatase PhoE [Paenibacillus sp. V4I3]|uniref:histidine phosphatase family protein n=1 Tax=Paenibacillus sp. V4I3 TaxID=3042305 RepID=UPI00278792B9|nr:broad specificity phosphatase PhoE [Paenibacillus sp. V4I3]